MSPAGGQNKPSVPIKPEHVEATLRRRTSVLCPLIEVESDGQHVRFEDLGIGDDPFQKDCSFSEPQRLDIDLVSRGRSEPRDSEDLPVEAPISEGRLQAGVYELTGVPRHHLDGARLT